MNQLRHPSRRLTGVSVSLIGIVIFILHIPHTSAKPAALLTADVIPLVLAFSLIYLGVFLRRSDLSEHQAGRVLWWTVGMLLVMTAIGVLFAYHEDGGGSSLSHVILVFASFGSVIGFVIGWYDVQEKQHARELRGFKNAVEEAGHSVMITGVDGTIEYVNPAFEEQTGYARADCLGKNPSFLSSGVHDDEFFEDMWDTITSGSVWEGEVVNVDCDGNRYTINQTIAPVSGPHGELDRFVAVNRDITELKAYEAELERQNERLDEFASVVSHDLRNPLSIAKGYTDLMRSRGVGEFVDDVEVALSRMDHIIDDVLTLAQSGDVLGEKTPTSLASTATQAWSNVTTDDATLTVDIDDVADADESRLLQAFENLYRNAIEHGGSDVTVTVGRTRNGFFVEDNGPGIPEDQRKRVLEHGYTTGENGTGLGLSIVQQIVTGHNWTLEVTESESGGARFEIGGVFVDRPGPRTTNAN